MRNTRKGREEGAGWGREPGNPLCSALKSPKLLCTEGLHPGRMWEVSFLMWCCVKTGLGRGTYFRDGYQCEAPQWCH